MSAVSPLRACCERAEPAAAREHAYAQAQWGARGGRRRDDARSTAAADAARRALPAAGAELRPELAPPASLPPAGSCMLCLLAGGTAQHQGLST